MTRASTLLAAARAAWPGIHVADEEFERYLAERAGGLDGAELHVADLYLACACARGDEGAIAGLERRYLAAVPGYLYAAGQPASLVDEVQQMVRAHLLVTDLGIKRRHCRPLFDQIVRPPL